MVFPGKIDIEDKVLEYSNALVASGRASDQCVAIRAKYAADEQFIEIADTLDRVKSSLDRRRARGLLVSREQSVPLTGASPAAPEATIH